MTTTVESILNRARVLLIDADGDRWQDDELVLWLNEALVDLVVLKPDANAVYETFYTAAGTLQTLPSGVQQLLDIPRNLSGERRPLRKVMRHILDAEDPTWHNRTPTSQPRAYVYDGRAPSQFYVYPPAAVDTALEVLVARTPEPVEVGDDVPLRDEFASALVDYVCYRAYLKDSDATANAQRAATHYEQYRTKLGLSEAAEASFAPTVSSNDMPEGGRVE